MIVIISDNLETFSRTENQFSGKTYFCTIRPSHVGVAEEGLNVEAPEGGGGRVARLEGQFNRIKKLAQDQNLKICLYIRNQIKRV